MRARIDVSEIEAQTKIRAKYLRALENEEWSLLPGPTFVKSFLRTYAQALGLDGRALVEEYRLNQERPSESMLEPIVAPSQRSQRSRGGRSSPGGPSRGYTLAVGAIVVVIILLVVLLATSGSGKKSPAGATTTRTSKKTTHHHHHSTSVAKHPSGSSDELALSLHPSGAIYVCLLGEGGRKLIPGRELQAGETTPTYHSKHFEITLGNNAVTMYLDGIPRSIPASANAIGYSITRAHGRKTLTSSELPTCK